ncbi:MAG: peptidylprolyl isomerase [Planctomycetes bacterium]|nr:peptidylprolyl isomerase [Planctomycetota bacterium]
MASTAPQRIADGKVVTIHYTLTSESGETLDSSRGQDPLEYLHGAKNIVPGLEKELLGKAAGENFAVRVAPEEGYGAHDPKGIQRVPRDAFPEDIELEPGMQFSAEDESGRGVTIWIQSVEGAVVTIDQNHPLAGQVLCFDVSVEKIRDATLEELSHGHPHGPGGHHHH